MTTSPMPADRFWQIIARAAEAADDRDAHTEALRALLRELSLDELVSFEVAFRRYLNEAYTWDLWGAAYVVNCGCSDDGFEYFRRWLVTRGRETYERALADPDSLAELDGKPGFRDVWDFEEIYYVAVRVFEEKGGDGDVRDRSETEAGLPRPDGTFGPEPAGQPFAPDKEHLAGRYPKLYQRFGAWLSN